MNNLLCSAYCFNSCRCTYQRIVCSSLCLIIYSFVFVYVVPGLSLKTTQNIEILINFFFNLGVMFVWVNSGLSSLWINLHDDWIKLFFSSRSPTAVLLIRIVLVSFYSLLFILVFTCYSTSIFRILVVFFRR